MQSMLWLAAATLPACASRPAASVPNVPPDLEWRESPRGVFHPAPRSMQIRVNELSLSVLCDLQWEVVAGGLISIRCGPPEHEPARMYVFGMLVGLNGEFAHRGGLSHTYLTVNGRRYGARGQRWRHVSSSRLRCSGSISSGPTPGVSCHRTPRPSSCASARNGASFSDSMAASCNSAVPRRNGRAALSRRNVLRLARPWSQRARPHSESFETRCSVQSFVVSHECQLVAECFAQHQSGGKLQGITSTQTMPRQQRMD
jgi:hypothetical protein